MELRGELLAAALMAAMGGSGREGNRDLGLWGVRERGEEKQNRNRVRRLAKAARESDGEATTVDDGVGGVARPRASGTRVARRRCQNGVVLGETRGARGGVDGGAACGQRRRCGAANGVTTGRQKREMEVMAKS